MPSGPRVWDPWHRRFCGPSLYWHWVFLKHSCSNASLTETLLWPNAADSAQFSEFAWRAVDFAPAVGKRASSWQFGVCHRLAVICNFFQDSWWNMEEGERICSAGSQNTPRTCQQGILFFLKRLSHFTANVRFWNIQISWKCQRTLTAFAEKLKTLILRKHGFALGTVSMM